jgi:hypothetical protein
MIALISLRTLHAGFPSVSSSQGSCNVTRTTVTCDLGNLATGGAAIIAITIRVAGPGTITNTASITANEPDPHPTNNTAQESTTVVVPPEQPGS